ncbi:glycosyltransferase [Cohnella sp.]|uniref:glycosyltransferase n=1 Tax=Cohnella sp. TaxID=1883426 RepID=UPI00356412A7
MKRPNLKPQVTIVICTYSRANMVGQTLLSLKQLTGIDQAEVILVDNNSPDNTAEVVSQAIEQLKNTVNIRYVFEPRQGLSVARNTGIDVSNGSIIAFLDDDAIPAIGWLSNIREAFDKYPEAAAIGGSIKPDFEISRPEWLVKGLELPYGIIDLGKQVRQYPRRLHPFGCNCAIRRKILNELRFPEWLGRKGQSLLSGEETWLFGQIRKRGQKLYYIPDMKISHFIPVNRLSPEWIKKRYYYQGVSNALEGKGLPALIRLIAELALRRVYIAFTSLSVKAPSKRLVRDCRLESIRGSVETLRSRGAAPIHE